MLYVKALELELIRLYSRHHAACIDVSSLYKPCEYKKAVLSQGKRAMPQ